MAGNLHDVVKLLIARMESHPEEFGGNDATREYISETENDRWWQARTLVMEFGTEEEKAAINAAMRKIKLGVAHEWMMDELCNGEERRRRLQEARDKEIQLKQQMYAAAQQSVLGAGSVNSALNAVGLSGYQNAAAHRQYYDAATDTYALGNGLKLTSEQVQNNPGLVAAMKKVLGL